LDLTIGYVLFGLLFLGGIVGYWVVTRALRDPTTTFLKEP
jgi:hypothetical protein